MAPIVPLHLQIDHKKKLEWWANRNGNAPPNTLTPLNTVVLFLARLIISALTVERDVSIVTQLRSYWPKAMNNNGQRPVSCAGVKILQS